MFTVDVLKMMPDSSVVTLSYSRNTGYGLFIDATNEVPRIYVCMDVVDLDFLNFFLKFFNNLAFSTK
jgi:hypothetical protein